MTQYCCHCNIVPFLCSIGCDANSNGRNDVKANRINEEIFHSYCFHFPDAFRLYPQSVCMEYPTCKKCKSPKLWISGASLVSITPISLVSKLSTISTLPSLAVCGLLHHYLASLQLTSDIVFGVLRWDEAARAGPEDYEGTPHVWLRVDTDSGVGVPIDNNYVAFPPNADNIEVNIFQIGEIFFKIC